MADIGMTSSEMTGAEASGPPPLTEFALPPLPGVVRFIGEEMAYWRLRIKGAGLLLLTLGIYRFWLMTDVRRFLWSNTEIDGETLEYNGLATELLVGFLFAIAILVPIYVGIAMASLTLGFPEEVSTLTGLALLIAFGEFARYRARRYRLTRTVFRGVRFNQRGSAWLYCVYAIFWWALVFLSLGLAYPWAQANLQRFMMRRTSYGDLQGSFEGSGWKLFLRGVPLWLLTVAPIVVSIAALLLLMDWQALGNAALQTDLDSDDDAAVRLLVSNLLHRVGLKALLGIGFGGIGLSILAAIVLYPLFQAIVYRWWLCGLRFGDIVVTSRLRIGQMYGIYGRFIGTVLLFSLMASIAGGIVGGIVFAVLKAGHIPGREVAVALVTAVLYAVTVLGMSVIHQVVVMLGLWRLAAQSTNISQPRALDSVHAAPARSSALGEGLADALGFGNF